METYIKVYAKAQNRTALGIIHAYLKINPDCTFTDLKEAFPEFLNPDNGQKTIFKTLGEILLQLEKIDWNGYFTDESCLLKFKDGTVAAVVAMWAEKNLKKLVEHAKNYGIVVADAESVDKALCKECGYYLEYLKPVKLEKMDLCRWPDTGLFNEIRQELTVDSVESYFEFIHFTFRKEDAKTVVYADGKKVYCADGDDCTKIMALGVLKGYVEQVNELLFEEKPSVAPEADKSDVIKFIEDYVDKMAPYIVAQDLNKKIGVIMELADQETLVEDSADNLRGSLTNEFGPVLLNIYLLVKKLNLSGFTSDIENTLETIQMLREDIYCDRDWSDVDARAKKDAAEHIKAYKKAHTLDAKYV